VIFNNFHWRFLKTKITLATVALFLFSLWSLAIYISQVLYKDILGLVTEQQVSSISLMAKKIDQELEEQFSVLNIAASAINFELLQDHEKLQNMLDCRPILQSRFNGGIVICRDDGVVVAEVPHSIGRINADYSTREDIAWVLKNNKRKVGKPTLSQKAQAPIFRMSVPIRDWQGKVIGVLAGITDLNKPNHLEKITESHYGKSGGYMIVDADDRLVVTATDKNLVMRSLPPQGVNMLLDSFVRDREGTGITINASGIQVLASARGIPCTSWYVAVALPTAEAFAPIRSMQQRIFYAAILLTLFIGSIIWMISKRLFSPALAAMQKLIDFSKMKKPLRPLPITRDDEVGELIRSFNRLLAALAIHEDELKSNWKRYQTILQTAMDGYWLIDAKGELLEVNDAYCTMSGYDKEELSAMPISSFETDGMKCGLMARLAKIRLSGEERFETQLRHKDGSYFDVDISAQFRPENDGQFVVFLRDIGQLKKGEEQFRLVFERSRDAIIWADPDTGIITGCNAKAEELTGRSREELVGMNHICLSPPEQNGQALFLKGIANSAGSTVEGIVMSTTGKRTPVRISTSVVDLGTNRIVQGIFHDITELKRVEAELRASEERNRYIVDTALEGIWVGDDQRKTIYVNQKYAQMLEYEPHEMIGLDVSAFVVPEQLEDHFQKLVVPACQERIYERCQRTKNGNRVWTLISARGMFDDAGKFLGSFAMISDITERKKFEDALQASLTEKECLLREIHHRVKNNLATIVGLLEIQAQSTDNSDSRISLLELTTRIKSMSLVHEQLYQSEDFSKIDFQVYLESLITGLRISYDEIGTIAIHIDAKDIEIGLDEAIPCGLIVTELITNAYKYAFPKNRPGREEHNREIAVTMKKDGKGYILTVSDSGVGLPAHFNWRKPETMGLLLVRMLCEHQLQGRMELDQEPNTVFTLRFTPKPLKLPVLEGNATG
jgi:PAS domain S-box-containing protein